MLSCYSVCEALYHKTRVLTPLTLLRYEFWFCRKYLTQTKGFDGWPALRGEGIEHFGRSLLASYRCLHLPFLDHRHDFYPP